MGLCAVMDNSVDMLSFAIFWKILKLEAKN